MLDFWFSSEQASANPGCANLIIWHVLLEFHEALLTKENMTVSTPKPLRCLIIILMTSLISAQKFFDRSALVERILSTFSISDNPGRINEGTVCFSESKQTEIRCVLYIKGQTIFKFSSVLHRFPCFRLHSDFLRILSQPVSCHTRISYLFIDRCPSI